MRIREGQIIWAILCKHEATVRVNGQITEIKQPKLWTINTVEHAFVYFVTNTNDCIILVFRKFSLATSHLSSLQIYIYLWSQLI